MAISGSVYQSQMHIKVHITGFACAYEEFGSGAHKGDPKPSRPQGSLYNQQKHAIADSIEWIRCNAEYKPRIFVATTPGYIEAAKEGSYIKRLTANLRNGYGMKEYVWVRELTKKGFPHFHFVADIPKFDAVQLSTYWSGLFGVQAKNSIRLGTRPNKYGKRTYWITGPKMAWYMSKYIGKDVDTNREQGTRRPYRTFAISETARKESQPLVYDSFIIENYRGLKDRLFNLSERHLEDIAETPEKMPPTSVNPHNYSWRWTGHGQTYVGFVRKRS